MPNASNVRFQEVDQSFFVNSAIKGLAAVSVRTKRGPFGVTDEVITSWSQFKKIYGGEVSTYDGPTLVKRALARGAMLRINKIGNYSTISNPASLTALRGTIDETGAQFARQASTDLFNLTLKYQGADYNKLTIAITAASNGDANSFNLSITHSEDSELNELYENLKIPGNPNVQDSRYLDEIIERSQLVDVVYIDLSGAGAGPWRPVNGTWGIVGGTDGAAITDTDYNGDVGAKNGVFAFDRFNDFEVVAPLDNTNTAVLTAYGNYAGTREDCVAFLHLANSNNTVGTLQAARTALNLNTRFAAIFAGGLRINDPITNGLLKNISALGDIIGAAMRSSAEFGEWFSFAGLQRGFIPNAVAVVNNFTSLSDQNLLAQRQINLVVARNGQVYIKGNFSAQLATSRKSFLNVVKLLVYIKKSLAPTFDKYLEQPNDFRTFREIYNEVDPFLASLASEDKRALVDYVWRGDQFAAKDSDLVVNNRPDLDQGKYLAELYLKEVVSLQEFTVRIISTPSGVSFEDNLN